MAYFPAAVKNTEEALNYLAKLAQELATVVTSAAPTLTAAAAAFVTHGIYSLSGGTTCTITSPTAAHIVAALDNPQVGTSFVVSIVNANSGTATMAGGTGVTVVGLATAATNTSATFRGVVTNATSGAEAVSLYRVD